jgi:hypothetical protein
MTTAIAHLREVLGDKTYELIEGNGGAMSTAAMVGHAYDRIDQARAELNAVSKQTSFESLGTPSHSGLVTHRASSAWLHTCSQLLMASEPARLDVDTYTSVKSKLCRWWAKRVARPTSRADTAPAADPAITKSRQ